MQKKIIKEICRVAEQIGKMVNLMEVCGTHTQAISRSGIREILPKNINLITGPGCPVCVTAQKDIDAIVSLALAGIPVATYGDVLRVGGRLGSLDQAREKGAQVFGIYDVSEALRLKNEYPQLVFFGLGFDTTTPMTAWGIKNGLTVYSSHKIFLPAMQALLKSGEINIDGFINPGHVSAIIGTESYKVLDVAQVITGFEAQDILEGILMLLKQIKEERRDVENQYQRVVKKEGNKKARDLIFDFFDPVKLPVGNHGAGYWRGFGFISGSGLEIKKEFSQFDAKVRYKNILDKVDFSLSKEPAGCRCGEVVRGLILPNKCPMFGKKCTTENPAGPCMVSAEGGCNVFFRYEKKQT